MLKKIKTKSVVLSFLSLSLYSNILISCSLPSNYQKTKENIVLKASDKSGYSVKLNIKTISKDFNTKSTESGRQAQANLTSSGGIRLVMSENSSDPYNNPISSSTNKLITNFDSYPSGIIITLSNLQSGKNYYLAARAFSDTSNENISNITEGSTYISSEYIQVTSDGKVSIINDSNNIGELDLIVPLVNAKGAIVDTKIELSNGTQGDFLNKDSLVAQTDSPSDNLDTPNISINDYGYGLISWVSKGGSQNKIYSKVIKDYMPSGNKLNNESVSSSDTLDAPIVSINNKGNGFLCWNYKSSGNGEIHFQYIKNINNNSSIFNINGNDFSECNLKVKPHNISFADSAIISWTDLTTGDLKARVVSSTDNFDSFNIGNMSTDINIYSEVNTINRNSYISNLNDEGVGLIAWENVNGTNKIIKYTKFKINASTVPASLNIIETNNVTSGNINLKNPRVAIDNQGNGFITWEDNQNIKYRTLESYKLISDSAFIPNLASSSTDHKITMNNKGDGLLIYSGTKFENNNYDIIGIKIKNYLFSNNSFKMDDVDNIIDPTNDSIYSQQRKSTISLDTNGNGYVSWLDDRATYNSIPKNVVYGKRIIDFFSN